MKTVNVARLKNQLSLYLSYVRRGGHVLVKDRNTPIAKIVPLSVSQTEDEEILAMAAAGVVRLPEVAGAVPDWFDDLLRSRRTKTTAERLIREERDEG
jgi:prevent-host-death family protein